MNGLPRKLDIRRVNSSRPMAGGTNNRNTDQSGRPIQRDDSWRDRTDRRVKGWDRGKTKRKVYVRRTYRDSLVWEEHVAILEKAGIQVQDLKPWEMKHR